MAKMSPDVPVIDMGNSNTIHIDLDPAIPRKFREISSGVTVGYNRTRPISLFVFGSDALKQFRPTHAEVDKDDMVLRVRRELWGTSDLSGAFNRIAQTEGISPRAVAREYIREFIEEQLDIKNAEETIAEIRRGRIIGVPASTLGKELNME